MRPACASANEEGIHPVRQNCKTAHKFEAIRKRRLEKADTLFVLRSQIRFEKLLFICALSLTNREKSQFWHLPL